MHHVLAVLRLRSLFSSVDEKSFSALTIRFWFVYPFSTFLYLNFLQSLIIGNPIIRDRSHRDHGVFHIRYIEYRLSFMILAKRILLVCAVFSLSSVLSLYFSPNPSDISVVRSWLSFSFASPIITVCSFDGGCYWAFLMTQFFCVLLLAPCCCYYRML